GKGLKGGFAIGGFDPTKAPGIETVNLMMVTPDSVRINIDNNPAKAVKGGFAIGSFDASKAINTKAFMNVSPQAAAAGQYNTFLGYQSGFKNKDNYNTFIGYRAGYNLVNGGANVFVGMNAGQAFNIGIGNVMIGMDAGLNVTEGERNVYIGHLAGKSASGDANVIVGQQAGENAGNPNFNVMIGQFAAKEFAGSPLANVVIGPNAGINGGGDGNTYIGAEAGSKAGYTDGNVYVGRNAGYYAQGSRNVILGYYAGYGSSASPLTGSNNVFIGYQAGYNEHGSNKLYIANSSSNPPLIYGDFSSGRIGLGTITPGHKLDLQQTITNGFVSSFANNGNTNTSHGFRVIAGNASSTGAIFIRFEKGYYGSSTTIGSITHSSTSGVAYNTTSDKRVKQNIRPTAESLEDLMGIGVYDFNFVGEDTGITQTGFLAQQLYDIYPAAVYKPEKPEELWMVDYSKLTPLLVKSVQKQQQIIEDQQKQIDIQNNKIERLEMMIEELKSVVAGK
ncbi:MAG TPA: tail fiber domain-containing protein, partial [Clostridia bacterium]|nr:tail fiber domain-containing protein [Clostridia bacterium]